MANEKRSAKAAFKDYCLIMQIHPEADAAMVDAAYWHLARRYSEAAQSDPSARAKLDELNEAYSVLGSAERREAYMKLRVTVLGEGALPSPPPSTDRDPPPLAVMGRQRPRPRGAPPPPLVQKRRLAWPSITRPSLPSLRWLLGRWRLPGRGKKSVGRLLGRGRARPAEAPAQNRRRNSRRKGARRSAPSGPSRLQQPPRQAQQATASDDAAAA